MIDFTRRRRLSMREAISETLDFVGDVIDDLGSHHEMNYLRTLLSNPEGTGADRQIAVYKETGNLEKVVEFLKEQTMKGIELDNTHSPERFLKFKQYLPVG